MWHDTTPDNILKAHEMYRNLIRTAGIKSVMKEFENTDNLIPDLVSVIVPVYNAEKYLRHCVESVISQSYTSFEMILIDDGSTDNSGKMCDSYAFRDNRIRAMHTENGGPAAARNIGIMDSKGEFIFFIDADDSIENNALSLLIENYNKHKADIVVGDFKSIKNGNHGPGHKGVFPGDKKLNKQDIIDYARWYLKKPNRFTLFAYSWGRLFKASIIKDHNVLFNTDLHTFEDVAFNFDYLRYSKNVFYFATVIYGHIINDGYMSATMTISGNPKRMFGYGQALANISNFLEYCGTNTDTKREVGHAYICLTIIQFIRICGQINKGNRKKIIEIVHGIVKDPYFRDNLKYYSPTEGDSRILPILMRLSIVWLIIVVGKYKANKRYNKGVVR